VWIAGQSGRVLHAENATWTQFGGTGVAGSPQYRGVWIDLGGDLGYAVGLNKAARFDGRDWTAISIPGAPNNFQAVWAASASAVWAVGVNAQIVHFNGSTWTDESSSLPTTATINDVWGVDANDVWAVGTSGNIVRRTAGTWALVPSNTVRALTAVHGTASNDVWAVGGVNRTLILHFDGVAWSPSLDVPGSHLKAIWARTPTDVWAVGQGGVTYHYDGTWTNVSTPTGLDLETVAGTATDDVWAGGAQGLVLHWDGVAWNYVRPLAGITGTLFDIAAMSRYVTFAGSSTVVRLDRVMPW
jgi:hypothetical protein